MGCDFTVVAFVTAFHWLLEQTAPRLAEKVLFFKTGPKITSGK